MPAAVHADQVAQVCAGFAVADGTRRVPEVHHADAAGITGQIGRQAQLRVVEDDGLFGERRLRAVAEVLPAQPPRRP